MYTFKAVQKLKSESYYLHFVTYESLSDSISPNLLQYTQKITNSDSTKLENHCFYSIQTTILPFWSSLLAIKSKPDRNLWIALAPKLSNIAILVIRNSFVDKHKLCWTKIWLEKWLKKCQICCVLLHKIWCFFIPD